MPLIDSSYFFDDLSIAQKSDVAVASSITRCINQYEPKLLADLLGYELYKNYKAGIIAATQKYLDIRDGKEYTTAATLTGKTGTYEQTGITAVGDKLGADLETLDKQKAQKYEIEGGVLVKKIRSGGPFSKTKMQDGFIITSVNGIDITSVEELSQAISSLRGESLQLEGMYPGYEGIYRYPLNIEEE